MPSIPIKQIGQGGMIRDLPEYALAPNQISTAFNIRYDNGVPFRCKGWTKLDIDLSGELPPTDKVYSNYKFLDGWELINNAENGIVLAITSTPTNFYKSTLLGRRRDSINSLLSTGDIKMIFYDGQSSTPRDISPDYGPIENFFTLDWSSVYGAVILNTQAGVPYIYAERDQKFRQLGRWIADLGADAACKIFTNFKNFYVAINMTETSEDIVGGAESVGNKIRWSGVIEPPIDAGDKEKIIVTASAATNLNQKYFTLYNFDIARHFWFNTTGLTATPPTTPTSSRFEIKVAVGATAEQVAIATRDIIKSSNYFDASNNSNVLTITPGNYGPNTPADFSAAILGVAWPVNTTDSKAGVWGNDPTWDETDLNALAGFMYLPDDYDSIVAAKKLSDKLMLYTLKSTYAMSFVGGTYVFSIAKVFMDDGCCSQFGVEEFDGKHFVVGRADVYVHDGNSKKSIIAGRIKEAFFSSISALELIKVFKNAKTQDIFVYYSSDDESKAGKYFDQAWVYNYRDDAWSQIELPNVEAIRMGPSVGYLDTTYDASKDYWHKVSGKSWSDYSSSVIAPSFYYISYKNNAVYLGDDGNQRDGDDYQSYITRGHIDLDEIFKSNYPIKYIKQILPSIEGEGVVNFTFSTSVAPLGDQKSIAIVNNISLGESAVNLSTDQYKIDTQFSGRYFSYTIRMNTLGWFKVHELELNIENRGMR